jgi:hypothetical protein
VFINGFRLPQVCNVSGNPDLLNYSAFDAKGAMVYDTCAGKIKRWSGSAWVAVADSGAGGGGSGDYVDTIYRKAGQDSIFYTINGGTERAVKDSVGSGGGGGTPGGGLYSIQYNRAGAFAGRSTFVFDTVNARVGIGTASPSATLSITSNLSVGLNSGINITNTASGTQAYAALDLYNNNNDLSQVFLTSTAWTPSLTVRAAGGGWINSGVGGLSFVANNNDANSVITFATGSLPFERMRINATGVQITGTTTSSGNISSSAAISATTSLNGRTGALTATAASDQLLSLKGAATHTGTFLSLKSSTNAEFAFFKANGTSATPNWYIGGPLNNVADPSNSAISAGAFIAYNASTNNFYGTGIGAIRSSKYDVWFQTGSNNGGGYRFYTEGTNERLTIFTGGNVGINSGATNVASAQLHVTSTTKGFLRPRLTTADRNAIASPAAGLSVYNSSLATNDVYTTAWYQQPNGLTGSGTLDFPSTGAHSSSDLTITVTGAAVGDIVILGTPVQDVDGTFTAFVSVANTVTVRFNHYGSGNTNPASGTFKVYVIKN